MPGIFVDLALKEIDEGEFVDAAISLLSAYQAEDPAKMWRWLRRQLGKERYAGIARQVSNAMLEVFDTREKYFKILVAKAFGKGTKEAGLSTERFLELLRRMRNPSFPVPNPFQREAPPPQMKDYFRKFRFKGASVDSKPPIVVDLRKDAEELHRLVAGAVDYLAAALEKSGYGATVSAVTSEFYLCQGGWLHLGFDLRPKHNRDGRMLKDSEIINIPAWHRAHNALQKHGGVIILPGGKKVTVKSKVSCKRLAEIYGELIKGVLLQAHKEGVLAKLSLGKACQLDVYDFDGNWAWPTYARLGKVNVLRSAR
jgi:hypothetical protein